ncbi:ABC transporter permease [Novosphingobium mangrovi (ex Huang et al. 2023)]|uniref:ABC transporter permease n=1 Tax=Novosphingobium mangrovi (ex Huang et al. 2023) TaxID=2976432 RepID=A0ABT2I1S6_9SPHN|nr:ABC transporter permease [Novosphingobium mangrovi (ex Huang et al. 2023)]MCT2398749.1 ABC transporter permease [Novosphingobium mangrovi (ex Huang et al. 2023)]
MRRTLENIYRLGVKELWSLRRDPIMLGLIIFAFTFSVYTSANALPETLQNASIAIVDEDESPLSQRIISAFYPPQFLTPKMIAPAEVDPGMDAGKFTFVLHIPYGFQRDVLAGHSAEIQLSTDATRMGQAFTGSSYIQQIVSAEVSEHLNRYRSGDPPRVDIALRARFNPSLDKSWFGALARIIDQITMLSIILTGAALIREREHGTVEHLLVMPVTPLEIMLSKVWSMAFVVLLASMLSLLLIVQGLMQVPVAGSLPLFFTGAALVLFATTSLGIFLATLARTMPQFGMLIVLVLMPLQMLSGGNSPRESMPQLVQDVMLLAPTTHFVEMGQAILFRGAGFGVVWPQFLAVTVIGAVFFAIALARFRSTISAMT